MIISDKQILQLMKIAEGYVQTLEDVVSHNDGMNYSEKIVENVRKLIADINTQQSDELKEIE